jgi:signal transduction histidine kinase
MVDIAVPVAGRLRAADDRRQIALGAGALLALAAASVSAAIALADVESHRGLVAAARVLMVGAPIAVGLFAVHARPGDRFGLLLVAAGAACFVTTLAESGDEVLYSIGRAAGWLVEVLLVYLILSFPTGRLAGRADRLLVGAMAAVVLTLYVPRLAIAAAFEVPSPFTSCVGDCPPNAFFLLDREPAFVGAVMRPLGAVLVFFVMAAVIVRLFANMRVASPLTRTMLAPVVTVAIARAGALGLAIVARQLAPGSRWVELAAWLLALAVPVIALALLVGLLQWRLFAGRALQHLAECVREVPDVATLQRAFAQAFGDPSIEIVFPASGRPGEWMDSQGQPTGLPQPGSGRRASTVSTGGEVVAVIVLDEGLDARPDLVHAGVAMAGVVLDNQRLAAKAKASIRELKRSRARISAGAERERRRIERDLHDGAQQRLVALRIELELAEDIVLRDPAQGVARLHELEGELDDALDDLRSLAHGVYPPLLADRGLAEALRAVAARSPLAVTLKARGVRRYRQEIESAVYFCLLEGLQNVLKHAAGARHVVVHLDGTTRDELRFGVRDDAAGTSADIRPGVGITNMKDRLAAVGGECDLTSTPGVGTVLSGRVAVAAHPPA